MNIILGITVIVNETCKSNKAIIGNWNTVPDLNISIYSTQDNFVMLCIKQADHEVKCLYGTIMLSPDNDIYGRAISDF